MNKALDRADAGGDEGAGGDTSGRSRFAGRSAGEILRELWSPRLGRGSGRDRAGVDGRGPLGRTGPSGGPSGGATRASAASTKEIVNGLDARERWMGIAAVVLAAAMAVEFYFVDHRSKTATVAHSASTVLIVGLVGAALIAVGVAVKRRALLGFASFLVGLAFLQSLIGVVFVAFGGWLVFRAMRFSKKQRDADGPPARSGGGSAAPGRHRKGAAAPAPRPLPPASKRYTPPKRTSAGRGKNR